MDIQCVDPSSSEVMGRTRKTPKYQSDAAERKVNFFRERRERVGMTQEQVGPFIKKDRSQLSKIEAGKVAYNEKILMGLAKAYKCTIPDLFRHPDDQLPPLVEEFSRLDEDTQERLLRAAEIFKKTAQ